MHQHADRPGLRRRAVRNPVGTAATATTNGPSAASASAASSAATATDGPNGSAANGTYRLATDDGWRDARTHITQATA